MGVQVYDNNFGTNGLAKAQKLFLTAHIANSEMLINHAEGKEIDAPRPVYDPTHPMNQWPKMVHHPSKGELTVATQKEYDGALKMGYRAEPYVKPQGAALSTAEQLIAAQKRNEELAGQVNSAANTISKLAARLDAIEKK